MTTSDPKRLKLRLHHLGIVGAFLCLWLGPSLIEQLQAHFQAELAAQKAETAGEPHPLPSQQGSDRFLESVLVRANYLLGKGREDGDVEVFIAHHYENVTAELTALKQRAGVFDGDAAIFARITNLSAEQQALELVQFWLTHPEQVKTVAGMRLSPGHPDITQEVDYAHVQP